MAPPLTMHAKFDTTRLVLRMKKGQKRLAYAAVNAINKTAKRVQREERDRLESLFTLRKKEFMKRQVAVIKPFASVREARAFAEISVGQKPRLLLSEYERGGRRVPMTPGAQLVAEPVIGGPARPDFKQAVPPEFRMSKLRFDRTKAGKRRVGVTRTATYLIPAVGIFQRLAGDASRAVYIFTRGKRIKPGLEFVQTAKRVARRWMKEEFEREVVKAIAHAAKGGGR